MSIIELIKEWAGVAVLVAGSFWGIAEVYFKWRKAGESTRQEAQSTEQAKLITEERELDLDSRRVEASEKVASDALEHLADTRAENLNLLEEVYNLKKGMVSLNNKVDELIKQLEFANKNICFEEDCSKRRPPLGTYKTKCLKEAENGKDA